MSRVPDELIQKATYTNLIAYCQSNGINLKREGHEFVVKDNDSIYISATEPYKWYRHSRSEGGKAIDFCIKYLGMGFQQAVEELTGASLPEIEIAPTKYYEPDFATDQKRVIAYLVKKREIEYNSVTSLIREGKLRQDKNGNAVFMICNFKGERVSAELHGTGSTRFKGVAKSQDGFGFSIQAGDVKQVAYFESAIDLLSFRQLYPQKTDVLYVSLAGLKLSVIENYQAHYPNAEHIVCVDDDPKGNEKANEFVKLQNLKRCKPSAPCKDWNEMLVYWKNNQRKGR